LAKSGYRLIAAKDGYVMNGCERRGPGAEGVHYSNPYDTGAAMIAQTKGN
jgi:hypothetical protein